MKIATLVAIVYTFLFFVILKEYFWKGLFVNILIQWGLLDLDLSIYFDSNYRTWCTLLARVNWHRNNRDLIDKLHHIVEFKICQQFLPLSFVIRFISPLPGIQTVISSRIITVCSQLRTFPENLGIILNNHLRPSKRPTEAVYN